MSCQHNALCCILLFSKIIESRTGIFVVDIILRCLPCGSPRVILQENSKYNNAEDSAGTEDIIHQYRLFLFINCISNKINSFRCKISNSCSHLILLILQKIIRCDLQFQRGIFSVRVPAKAGDSDGG